MITKEALDKLLDEALLQDHCTAEKQCELCATTQVFAGNREITVLAAINIVSPDPREYIKALAAFFLLGQVSVTTENEISILEKMFKENK
jgi:hypothetical protein